MGTLTYKGVLVPDAADTTDGADVQNTLGPGLTALATIAVALSAARAPTANDDMVGTGGLSPIAPPGFFVDTATTPPTIFQCTSAATGAAVWQQIYPASIMTGTQSANEVFAGPASGSAAAPTFRAIALADLPSGATPPPPETQTDSGSGCTFTTTTNEFIAVVGAESTTFITLPSSPTIVNATLTLDNTLGSGANVATLPDSTTVTTAAGESITVPVYYNGTEWVNGSEPASSPALEYSDSHPLIDANNHLLDDPANVPTVIDYTGGGASISGSDQGFQVVFGDVALSGGAAELGQFAFAGSFASGWFPTVSMINPATDQGNPIVVGFVTSAGAPTVIELVFPAGDTISGSLTIYIHVRSY